MTRKFVKRSIFFHLKNQSDAATAWQRKAVDAPGHRDRASCDQGCSSTQYCTLTPRHPHQTPPWCVPAWNLFLIVILHCTIEYCRTFQVKCTVRSLFCWHGLARWTARISSSMLYCFITRFNLAVNCHGCNCTTPGWRCVNIMLISLQLQISVQWAFALQVKSIKATEK